jgi:hypothetical protein
MLFLSEMRPYLFYAWARFWLGPARADSNLDQAHQVCLALGPCGTGWTWSLALFKSAAKPFLTERDSIQELNSDEIRLFGMT